MFGIVQLSTENRKIKSVVAGTFDKLHTAHKLLISEAFKNADYVIIGVMSDRCLSGKIAREKIDPFEVRVKRIIKYCDELTKSLRAKEYEVVEITGPYDVVLEREDLDILVVSEETLAKGVKINILRSRKGWKPLKLIVVPLMKAADGRPLTSHRIRLDEIDTYGNLKVKIKVTGESHA